MGVKELLHEVEERTARITVLGQGYVGLPLSIRLAKKGIQSVRVSV